MFTMPRSFRYYDLILGAFVAGGIIRMLLPADHAAISARLDGIGYGWLPDALIAAPTPIELAQPVPLARARRPRRGRPVRGGAPPVGRRARPARG